MTDHPGENKFKPILLVISATLLWSIGSPISKITYSSPMVLIFFRCLSGLAVLAAAKTFTGGKLFKLKPQLIIGGALYAVTSLSFYTALKFTTAANATVLGNTSPFFLAILGFIFLNEKPAKRDWFILALVITGIVFCFYGGISLKGTKGDLLALLVAVLFSFLAIIIKKSGDEDAMQPLIWGNLIAVLITAPSLLKPDAIIIRDIPFFVILGVFQMALPFFLYARGQMKLGAMEASLFKLLEPIAATIWVVLIVGEIPTLYSIIGGALVIAALFFKTFLEYRYSA